MANWRTDPLGVFLASSGPRGNRLLFRYPFDDCPHLGSEPAGSVNHFKRKILPNEDCCLPTKPSWAGFERFVRDDKFTGFPEDALGNLLAATSSLCDLPFMVKVNDVVFAGYPKQYDELLSSSSDTKLSNTVFINIVFALHEEVANQMIASYQQMSKMLSTALIREEARCSYLSNQKQQMWVIQDEISMLPEDARGQTFARVVELCSLGRCLMNLFQDLKETGCSKFRINDWIQLTFRVRPSGDLDLSDPPTPFGGHEPKSSPISLHNNPLTSPSDIMKRCFESVRPYHGLLLVSNRRQLADKLERDTSQLFVRLLRVCAPTRNLCELAYAADLTVFQVNLLVAQLLYWGKATVIHPIQPTSIYMLNPTVKTVCNSALSAEFSSLFPGDLTLINVISQFSGATRFSDTPLGGSGSSNQHTPSRRNHGDAVAVNQTGGRKQPQGRWDGSQLVLSDPPAQPAGFHHRRHAGAPMAPNTRHAVTTVMTRRPPRVDAARRNRIPKSPQRTVEFGAVSPGANENTVPAAGYISGLPFGGVAEPFMGYPTPGGPIPGGGNRVKLAQQTPSGWGGPLNPGFLQSPTIEDLQIPGGGGILPFNVRVQEQGKGCGARRGSRTPGAPLRTPSTSDGPVQWFGEEANPNSSLGNYAPAFSESQGKVFGVLPSGQGSEVGRASSVDEWGRRGGLGGRQSQGGRHQSRMSWEGDRRDATGGANGGDGRAERIRKAKCAAAIMAWLLHHRLIHQLHTYVRLLILPGQSQSTALTLHRKIFPTTSRWPNDRLGAVLGLTNRSASSDSRDRDRAGSVEAPAYHRSPKKSGRFAVISDVGLSKSESLLVSSGGGRNPERKLAADGIYGRTEKKSNGAELVISNQGEKESTNGKEAKKEANNHRGLFPTLCVEQVARVLECHASRDPVNLALFARLVPYFDGSYPLEAMVLYEGLSHAEISAIVDKFGDLLVVVQHPDPLLSPPHGLNSS